ncbi:MAG: ComEC/Rec2 family competence protein [Solirubrobacterales bacterium]
MIRTAAVVGRHPRHVIAASLAIGLALGHVSAYWQLLASLLIAILLLSTGVRGHVAVAACGMLIAGGALGDFRLSAIDADPLAGAPSSRPLTLRGDLVRHVSQNDFGSTLRLRVDLPGGDRQLVEVRSSEPAPVGLSIGSRIEVVGHLRAVADALARDGPGASYARFLLREGIRRRIDARTIVLTGEHRGGAYGFVDSIRARSERALAFGLAAEPAALLRGMVLGGDSGIPEPVVEDFRASGLAHVLAVSGQNVLLIVILVRAILIAVGVGWLGRVVVPAILVCVYVPLCGAQASVVRAGVMGLAGLAAIAASRPSSRIYSLLLASIAVLVWNPRATADIGAQLSFCAVLGIMAFTGPVVRWLDRVAPVIPPWAAEALAATLGATLATAPLMAYHFERFSLVSLAVNVLATPLIGMIVWLGSLTAAIGQVATPVGGLLNAPNAFVLGTLIELAEVSASVPGAEVVADSFGSTGLIAAFCAIGSLAAFANGWLRPPPAFSTFVRAVSPPVKIGGALAIGVACVVAIASPWRANPPLVRPSITLLDVGQGDAMLIRGRSGCDVLIDGGPDRRRLKQLLERHRVKRLNLAVITHSHDDHYNGFASLDERRAVKIDLLLDGGGQLSSPVHRSIVAAIAASGTDVTPARAGLRWRCGDIGVDVLAPPDPPASGDPNESSVVTSIEVDGIRLLATGDAESPQLASLALGSYDVLKVPHHGSADPGLPGLLARTRPRIALIAVGRNNRHGHPAPPTVDALSAAGTKVYRTDQAGSVTVRFGGDRELLVDAAGPGR